MRRTKSRSFETIRPKLRSKMKHWCRWIKAMSPRVTKTGSPRREIKQSILRWRELWLPSINNKRVLKNLLKWVFSSRLTIWIKLMRWLRIMERIKAEERSGVLSICILNFSKKSNDFEFTKRNHIKLAIISSNFFIKSQTNYQKLKRIFELIISYYFY